MDVSVIVPTTRKERVKKTIDSLLNQKTKYRYEIVIAGQKKVFASWPRQIKKVVSQKKLNPSEARNFAAKRATGEHFLFLDDDCLVQPDWIEKNISFLKKRKKVGAVGGRLKGFSSKYFALCVDYTNLWRQQSNQPRETNQLYTASLGVKKSLFDRVGGFNEKLWVGEDVDFVQKLDQLGYQSYYQPSILVLHDHERDNFLKFSQYMYRNGLTSGLNILKTYGKNPIMKLVWQIVEKTYFLWILPMALIYTAASLSLNFSSFPQIVFLLPFVFWGYLVYHLGIGVKASGFKKS